MTVAALNQSDRGKEAVRGQRRLAADHHGLGRRRRLRRCGWPAASPARTSTRRSRSPTRCAAASRGARSRPTGPRRCSARSWAPRSSTSTTTTRSRASTRRNKVTRGTPDSVATFSIFATFPAPYFSSPVGPLIDQIIGTALLVAGHLRGDRRVQHARQGQPRAARGRPRSSSASASPSAPTPATRSTPPATSARGCWPGSRAGSRWRYRATTARSTSTCGSRSSGPLIGGVLGAYALRLRGPRRADRARRRARPRDRGGGARPPSMSQEEQPRHEQVRRSDRPGHDQLALHPVRQGRQHRPHRPARARADQPEGGLGRARRDRDLAEHAAR